MNGYQGAITFCCSRTNYKDWTENRKKRGDKSFESSDDNFKQMVGYFESKQRIKKDV